MVYEVRGFWEDTWLSRHPDSPKLAASELYQRNRDTETRCMLAADLVVTLGEAMREEIMARGVPAEKILIVPNAVSQEFLKPLPDAAALRHALGIDPDEYLVGVVSSLVRHEGIGTLLEATAILRGRRVPARVLIVGDGPERAALQRQAARGRPGAGGRLHRPRARGESTPIPRAPRYFRRSAHARSGLSARDPVEARRGHGERSMRGH